ncbi:MAG: ribonuclease VapC [archaeon]
MSVLDASAFINSSEVLTGKHITSPKVVLEIKDDKSKLLLEYSLSQGFLEIKSPKKSFLEIIKKKAKEIGSFHKLSEADLEVLALALEYGQDIITDDYTIQNVAAFLKIAFHPVSFKPIVKKRKFKIPPRS